MRPAHGNGQPRFTVSMSGAVRADLNQLHQQAMASGQGEAFRAALRHILERLGADPRSFGDPQYRLAALQLMVYQAVVSPLVVNYAVHDNRPLVFIRAFQLMA